MGTVPICSDGYVRAGIARLVRAPSLASCPLQYSRGRIASARRNCLELFSGTPFVALAIAEPTSGDVPEVRVNIMTNALAALAVVGRTLAELPA